MMVVGGVRHLLPSKAPKHVEGIHTFFPVRSVFAYVAEEKLASTERPNR